MKTERAGTILFALTVLVLNVRLPALAGARSKAESPVVDTGQSECYDNYRQISCPQPGEPFYGQDAQYDGLQMSYRDNGDGTVTDRATGLMWMRADSSKAMNWAKALEYAADLEFAGYDEWRLPSVKELQSIVDYSRAPDARDPSARGAAIDPVFRLTKVESWFWTSTTHIENGFGYYVCFGQGLSARTWVGKPMNAHGAGAVRSDPKSGHPSRWPNGLGPQADEIRIYNYARCVRDSGGKPRS